jgi:nicotinamidase-related amidase
MDNKNYCFVLIDMQYGFLSETSPLFVKGGPQIIDNLALALEYTRQHKIPRIFVQRLHRANGYDVDKPRIELFRTTGGFLIEGTKGAEIVAKLKPEEGEFVITKKRWSAFFQTELDLILRRQNIDTLIIGGVQTPNCIRATFTDAISLDYGVIVLEDGTASNSEEIQRANLIDMKNMGGRIMSVKETIDLLRY